MAFSVEMPELGESVTEGTVTTWLKQVGDTVAVDEPLLEVSTDKVDTEIPSPVAGVLTKIIADEDDTVEVGEVIAEIGEEGDDTSSDDSGASEPSDSGSGDSGAEEKSSSEGEKSQKSSDSGSSGSGPGEATDVEMPELGESVTEGTITQWLKSVGDEVEVDEPLLEVSTDKVDTEIPSPVAGTLVEVLAEEDDTVDVGSVIARIGDANAASSSSDDSSDDKAESTEAEEESPAEDDEQANASSSEDKGANGSGSGEATDVEMPELGESVTEGTITQWLKSVGDEVEVDEPLLEVSTDKVDTEIPSPIAGTLVEVLAEEDDTVDVGSVIARIGDANAASSSSDDEADKKAEETKSEEKSEPEPSKSEKAEETKDTSDSATSSETASPKASSASAPDREEPATRPSTKVNTGGKLPYVTPLVRKLAEKHSVDLTTVEGSGVGGRIRKQDVLAAAEKAKAAPDTSSTSGNADEKPAQDGPRAAWSTKRVDPKKAELIGTTQKVNRIRSLTASKTLESLHSSAQLTQVHEVDMTDVAALRKASKPAFKEKYGVNLTYLPFFAKAVVEALISHPNVNASYNAETKEMTYHDKVNLGIAVDTEAGLLSPVIHNAQDMTLPELAAAIADIADRARTNKLKPNDLTGGTFTITNIGSEGALTDTPILVPPQAAMMGTGAIVKRPSVVPTSDGSDAIAIRQMVLLPLTYDHQIVDGADAGRFMTTVRDRLETANFESDLDL
ncbi:2-oxoglutarate dehydrogenase, E2 component, dihydrolipoamide succinyltransferase [Corynebacterium kroppenstedtii]|uniref:Dihydrolipoamide acetyltransferase component of pyruvate dehydrogenase complex n=1 Tax=Corynebacterium kroppenstedtii (strain DSM 44385 / JCM 11950 / CIP 105744 / CCUG 35717) TaxID=645127 RepID=C4LI06_CORK4|nr:2-oxoglutarate dehydrogenase, E2 component, dihydrolipoamide succinyltransferase [Corynebacterium kroppenstedtii]ACR17461.1 dihydrolipoamide succinyltransferase [Corynebacterium kroppenstedtii DSM 44385]QRP11060.1 2-oxoglutarate dehydrogenase, E2 component, dihydrolipoamide succinyltransferase [Corynebacterium kroppenstedtii]